MRFAPQRERLPARLLILVALASALLASTLTALLTSSRAFSAPATDGGEPKQRLWTVAAERQQQQRQLDWQLQHGHWQALAASGAIDTGPGCERHDQCVFVLSTGRSGSTNLQDALNQVPGVLVRGENGALTARLFNLSRHIDTLAGRQRLRPGPASVSSPGVGALQEGPALPPHEEYEVLIARRVKPAWFSGFPKGSGACVAAAVFRGLYSPGPYANYTVGFKEIRLAYLRPTCGGRFGFCGFRSYPEFEEHLEFLRGLCRAPHFVFNLRRDLSATSQSAFYRNKAGVQESLAATVSWFEKYARTHSDTFTAYHEDMFDPAVNASLARDLLRFLGKGGALPAGKEISFARIGRDFGY